MPKKDTSFCTEIYIRENCSDRRENAPSIFILYFFGGDNWTVFVSALPQAKQYNNMVETQMLVPMGVILCTFHTIFDEKEM